MLAVVSNFNPLEAVLDWLHDGFAFGVEDTFLDMRDWVRKAWQGMVDAVSNFEPLQAVLDWLHDVFALNVEDMFLNIRNWAGDAWEQMIAAISGDGLLLAIQGAWQAVLDWLASFSLYDAGAAILATLGDGIASVKDIIKEKVKSALGVFGRLLPESDAQEGPLSRLTASGRSIVETIAEGIESAAPLFTRALENVQLPLPVGPVPPQAFAGAAAAGAGGNTTEVYMTVNEGAVKIYTQNGDPAEITGALDNFFKRQVRSSVEQADDRRLGVDG